MSQNQKFPSAFSLGFSLAVPLQTGEGNKTSKDSLFCTMNLPFTMLPGLPFPVYIILGLGLWCRPRVPYFSFATLLSHTPSPSLLLCDPLPTKQLVSTRDPTATTLTGTQSDSLCLSSLLHARVLPASVSQPTSSTQALYDPQLLW